MAKMREFTRLDRQKVLEYVEDAVNAWGGKILKVLPMKTVFKFFIGDCATWDVADHVNQRLGKFAYPWEACASRQNLLKVGWRVRG